VNEMDQVKKILNPKVWLILTALIHAVVGIISQTDWADDPQVLIGGFMLLTSVTMLYVAFFIEGEEQARLTAVIAGPAWVWFVVSCAMGLTWQIGTSDVMEMTFAENIPPLVIWGLTALSGVLHGNFQNLLSGESQ
tara:strand:+ start:541 stop:948 length:408 start_codon:yes stop_codon:yes gene_type:complete